MKTSNKFTLARLLFAPVFYFIYNLPVWTGSRMLAVISACLMIPLLIVIELTDYWDGHYARKYGEVSDIGKIFDPFADVMMNLTVFICAMTSYSKEIGGYMPVVIFIFIFYREFSQNFLRMVAMRQGVAVAARKGGKIKTVFYIISGFFMLTFESAIRLDLGAFFGFDMSVLFPYFKGIVTGWFIVCLILSYVSFIDYLKSFASVLKNDTF